MQAASMLRSGGATPTARWGSCPQLLRCQLSYPSGHPHPHSQCPKCNLVTIESSAATSGRQHSRSEKIIISRYGSAHQPLGGLAQTIHFSFSNGQAGNPMCPRLGCQLYSSSIICLCFGAAHCINNALHHHEEHTQLFMAQGICMLIFSSISMPYALAN